MGDIILDPHAVVNERSNNEVKAMNDCMYVLVDGCYSLPNCNISECNPFDVYRIVEFIYPTTIKLVSILISIERASNNQRFDGSECRFGLGMR